MMTRHSALATVGRCAILLGALLAYPSLMPAAAALTPPPAKTNNCQIGDHYGCQVNCMRLGFRGGYCDRGNCICFR